MKILSFKRIEKKYLINRSQYEELLKGIRGHMKLDPYCENNKTYKIQNIYYDTINNTLISNSINKPIYKEKLRIRKYYEADSYFIELKKKACGVVGKRRVVVNKEELDSFFRGDNLDHITDYESRMAIKEIKYLMKRYELMPKVYLSYDRLGFFDLEDPTLRLTLDNNIHSRRSNLSFKTDESTIYVIKKDEYILEIKVKNNYPLWLARILDNLKIRSSSFSKYGEEYKLYLTGGKYA